MKFLASFALVFPFLLDSVVAELVSGQKIADSWIVTLKDEVKSNSIDSHFKWLDEVIGSSTSVVANEQKPGVAHKYTIGAFNGYAGVFSQDVVEQIRKRGDVPFPKSNLLLDTDFYRFNLSTKMR